MLDYLPHETDVTEMVDHLITGVNLAYDLFTHKSNKLTVFAASQGVQRDSYYGANKDPFAYGFTEDLTTSVGAQYVLNSESFLNSSATTIFGIDNNNNQIMDTKLGANGKENTIITNQMVNTLGSFIQQDLRYRKLNLGLGLRFDNYLVADL